MPDPTAIDRPATDRPRGRTVVFLLSVIALVLTGWALKETRSVAMPLALAFFIAVVLRPIQKWLNDKLPRKMHWLSLVAVMALFLGIVGAGGAAIGYAGKMVAKKAPEYQQKFGQVTEQAKHWARERGLPVDDQLNKQGGMRDTATRYAKLGFNSLLDVVTLLVLVFFLVLLMLLETHTWHDKSRNAFRHDKARKIIESVDAISDQVRRYLVIRTFVSILSGVLSALWLWFMKVDFPLVWGLLIFILNYIPTIGSIISFIPPSLFAILQLGVGKGLIVLAGLVLLDQITGNYIDPRLQGKKMSISPVVILMSVLFWGWIWGAVGAVIAVPLMATIIIVCLHIPALRPVALLLSNSTDEQELKETIQPDNGEAKPA